MKQTFRTQASAIFLFMAMSLLFISCHKEEELVNSIADNYEYVTVGIDVCAGDRTQMTPSQQTKSITGDSDDIICELASSDNASFETRVNTGIDDPTPTSATAIKNLWVLQYDGVTDSARLIESVYIENYNDPNNRNVKLIASVNPNTIVFLANTFDNTLPFQRNSTITELKQRRFTTQSLGTILSKEPSTATVGGGLSFPDDGNYFQRLNGYIEQPIQANNNLVCSMGHNSCRIAVNVTNNTAGTTYPVTLTSADIENVPGCTYFFTDYPGYTSGNNVGKPTTNDFELYGQRTYSNVITWTISEGTSSTTKSAHIYIPANESGVVAVNTNQKLKSLFAPTRSTKLRIHGTYYDGIDNIPITYTFSLGADMTTDYQLVPNGNYIYNISLNARGDKTTDPRVSYAPAGGIDYTQTNIWPLSNCYICNPPTISTQSNTYKIPVGRVDQFWGDAEKYENEPNNCLATANAWTVSVIWSDMEVKTENFVLTKATGTGKDDFFEVSVPGTSEMGNVIIGLKRNDGTDWLWSWHLWVTDYRPDEAKYLAQQGAFIPGTDTYHLTGGDVQRLKAAATGTVQKVYMDRSVGTTAKNTIGGGRGVLYYQFGRKDPFPGPSVSYWEGGISKVTTGFYNTRSTPLKNCIERDLAGENSKNVPYSVKHPTTFILTPSSNPSSNWTIGDKYNNSDSYIWMDTSSSEHGDKSIFDPSPSGWKIPTDFDGLFIGPYVMEANIGYRSTSIVPDGYSFSLPYTGYLNARLRLDYETTGGFCWMSRVSSTQYGWFLYAFNKATMNTCSGASGLGPLSGRGFGVTVRPIQE